MPALGSLFDGIGVFPLAASLNGITPVWASEIEKAPVSITRRRFPGMEHLGDITKLHGGSVPPVDIITFGSPCQNLSSSGNREGLAGEKSGLFHEAIRLITEMREATENIYPTFAVWENVMGAFTSNDRMDYAAVLRAFTGAEIPMPVSGGWAPAGMVRGGSPDLAWRVLDAAGWGTAQRRRRVFLVADFRGQRAGEVLFKPRRLHKVSEYGEGGGLPVSPGAGKHSGKTGRARPAVYAFQDRKMRGAVQYQDPRAFRTSVGRPDCPCPTLLASDIQIVAIHYPDAPEYDHIRRLTPLEYERLMGLPEGWTEQGGEGERISDNARYKALGNAIALPCAAYIMAGIAETGF